MAALVLAVGEGVAGTVRAARRFTRSPDRAGLDNASGAGEQELLAGAAAVLSTVLGQGLVDFPLRNPVVESVTWLAVGLLAAACRLQGRTGGAGRPARPRARGRPVRGPRRRGTAASGASAAAR